jgi:ERCC4-type nuclease
MSAASRKRRAERTEIVIDTREPVETAYKFAGFKTVRQKLETGDYSILGHESRVTVERKEHGDAYGVVGANRERFERELERLAKFECPAIVIEADLADFATPPPYTRIVAAQAVGSFVSWSVRYRIPVWFCHGRREAERVTLRILGAYLEHLSGGKP